MPIKLRRAKNRTPTLEATPAAVAFLETCLRLRPKLIACRKPVPALPRGHEAKPVTCPEPDPVVRCADCTAFYEARGELHRLYGRRLWQEHIDDVPVDFQPPPWMDEGRQDFNDFRGAVEIRKLLEKARQQT